MSAPVSPPITRDDIQAIYSVERARCQALYPFMWAHHSAPCCQIMHTKRTLGKATSRGIVHISSLFIGTTARDKVRDTIRHELAHLAAGVRAGHGKPWRLMAVLFGSTGDAKACAKSLPADLLSASEGKYRLFAVTVEGARIDCGTRHRRDPKYRNYVGTGDKPTFRVRGQAIARFEYVTTAKAK